MIRVKHRCTIVTIAWLTTLVPACSYQHLTQNNQPSTIISSSEASSNTSPKPTIINYDAIPKAQTVLNCADISDNQRIHISQHTQLSQQCDLRHKSVTFIINSSHASLDCQGARLSQRANDSSKSSAITIKPKNEQEISHITVANCHIEGYGHALNIRQKSNPNSRYTAGVVSKSQNRQGVPHKIHILNLTAHGSKNSGIFVGDHVYDVHFNDISINKSGTVGLYLEFGSSNIHVENSLFTGNGFRLFKPNREAIAIDASANNIIENNTFINNGAGSVFLYRNCFEHAHDPSRSNHFKRTQSSDNNMIAHNVFKNEPVGVWIASRQSRNLIGFRCGAYTIKKTATASYHLDSAQHNSVTKNRFIDVNTAVIVEDDHNTIDNNDFSQSQRLAIKVGSTIREQGDCKNIDSVNKKYTHLKESQGTGCEAIQGTKIINNRFATLDADKHIEITPASQALTSLE